MQLPVRSRYLLSGFLFFRPNSFNGREVHGFCVAFQHRYLLSLFLKGFQEVGVFPRAALDLVPAEQLVISGRNSSQIKVPILIGRQRFVQSVMRSMRCARHENDPHTCSRQTVLVGCSSLVARRVN